MKKFTIYILLSALALCFIPMRASALGVSASSCILVEQKSGQIVYEKNAHERRGMASTTKIMTAIIAIENSSFGKNVEVADEAIGVEGSSIYLKKGESLTMEQLVYALLLQSANDAATAIAIEVAGSVDGFAEMMNAKALELGLKNTHFTNPHGLFDDDHYTTAYDLAMIARHAMENETFKKIVSTKKYVIESADGTNSRVLVNHNKLLNSYDGAVGIKTGFTKKTGRCLVSAAERNGLAFIAVTLQAPNDWSDHKALLDLGFEKMTCFDLASPDSIRHRISVVGGKTSYVDVSNVGGLSYVCLKETAYITKEVILPRFCFAPIKKGDVIGRVIFYNNGDVIGQVDLVATTDVEQDLPTRKKLFGIF